MSSNKVQEFVAAPALAPPEAQVDEALLAQYQAEMNAAANQPLPGEDDDDDL
jgi:GTP-binding nuclear protein Ran